MQSLAPNSPCKMAIIAVNRDIKSVFLHSPFPKMPIQEWRSEGREPVIPVPGQPELLLLALSFNVTQQLIIWKLTGGMSIVITLHLWKNKLRSWLSKFITCKFLTIKIISNLYHLSLLTSKFRIHICCFLLRRPRLIYSLQIWTS